MEESHSGGEKGSLHFNTFRNRVYQHRFLTLGIVGATVVTLGLGLGVGLGLGLGEKRHSFSSRSNIPRQSSSTLYQPAVGSGWQIVLDNPVNASNTLTPNVPVFDIDMFGNTNATITMMHSQGLKVICYFSAGTYEPNRPDSNQFNSSDLGNPLTGYPDEYWLNTQSQQVRNIMVARIKLAATKGCDAIDPDDMDGFETTTGFNLTASTALDYLTFLSETAACNNMSIGLKNAGTIAANATSLAEFAIVESCVTQGDCSVYQPFIAMGKPVFSIEYPSGAPGNVNSTTLAASCAKGKGNSGFSEILKDTNLDGWIEFCDGVTANTSVSS